MHVCGTGVIERKLEPDGLVSRIAAQLLAKFVSICFFFFRFSFSFFSDPPLSGHSELSRHQGFYF